MSVSASIDKISMRMIERRLKKLPANVQRNLSRKALRKAMAMFRKDAKNSAPKLTNRLKKSIKSKVSLKRTGEMTGHVFVKTRGKNTAPHAHLVEWGSTNNSPSRFMSRSFEKNREQVIAEFKQVLLQEIAKVASR